MAGSCPEFLAKWAPAEVGWSQEILPQKEVRERPCEQAEAGARLSMESFSWIIFLLALARELHFGL